LKIDIGYSFKEIQAHSTPRLDARQLFGLFAQPRVPVTDAIRNKVTIV
jgi:hypothetical protein